MPEPVFDQRDKVDPPAGGGDGLPEHLKGKSAADIVAYYERREKILKDQILQNQPADPPPPQPGPKVTITKEEFWNDPVKAAQTLLEQGQRVTQNDFDKMTAPYQKTVIQFAEDLASRNKADWTKWLPQVKQIMATLPPHQQADVETWNIAYNNVRGANITTIVSDAVKAATTGAEPVQPPADNEPAPQPITDPKTLKMLDGLGVTPERYHQAGKQIDKGEWPLTFDSRRKA